MSAAEDCDECGYRVDSHTHAKQCPVGIVAFGDVDRVRALLAIEAASDLACTEKDER